MIVNFSKEYSEEECCVCAIVYFVTAQFQRKCKETKQSFYCPNGHSQSYTKSEADRLRDLLETQRKRTEQAENQNMVLSKKLRDCQKPKKPRKKRVAKKVTAKAKV